jgi:hypothetical protein
MQHIAPAIVVLLAPHPYRQIRATLMVPPDLDVEIIQVLLRPVELESPGVRHGLERTTAAIRASAANAADDDRSSNPDPERGVILRDLKYVCNTPDPESPVRKEAMPPRSQGVEHRWVQKGACMSTSV